MFGGDETALLTHCVAADCVAAVLKGVSSRVHNCPSADTGNVR